MAHLSSAREFQAHYPAPAPTLRTAIGVDWARTRRLYGLSLSAASVPLFPAGDEGSDCRDGDADTALDG